MFGVSLTSFIKRLSRRERLLTAFSAFLLVAGLLWATRVFVNRHTSRVPADGGTLSIGVVGQPRFVLPLLAHTNDADMDLTRLVYGSLVTVDADGSLVNDLADSIVITDDGKTYTVKLRNDVRWHDGEPFTANDVVTTIHLIQDPTVKSPIATKFQGVEVTKVDEHTVRFSLKEPYAPFLYSLQTGIIPAHIWSDVPPQGIALSEHVLRPVGTGPFAFEKLKKAEFSGEVREYRLSRSSTYHGNRPHLTSLIFRFYPTTDELLRALRRGEVTSASFLPPSSIKETGDLRNIRVQRLHLPQYFAVFLNQTKNTILAEGVVRQALAGIVDRDRLIKEALHGEGSRVETAIPPGSIGYMADVPTGALTLEQARQNLETAGWKDTNGDGIREKDNRKFSFTLATTDWPEYVATANLLAEQWRALGAEVSTKSYQVGSLQADVLRPRDYEALLYGEVLGADPDPYPFWHSTQTRDPGLNLALFKDTEADKLLETARRTTDPGERSTIYRQFQERILKEAPAIFLYSPTYAYALPRDLEGTFLEHAPLPADRYAAIATWYLKTRRVWNR